MKKEECFSGQRIKVNQTRTKTRHVRLPFFLTGTGQKGGEGLVGLYRRGTRGVKGLCWGSRLSWEGTKERRPGN